MSNKYNNNKHDPKKKNNQSSIPSEHGELRSGRLSTFKNHNPISGEPENEYLDDMADDRSH